MCPVVLVPGNREYYRGCFVADRARLVGAELPNLHVLDRGEANLSLRDGRCLRVLGAALWTDYRLHGDPVGPRRLRSAA